MHTSKKQTWGIIFGLIICTILTGVILGTFIGKSRRVEKIDCSHIPIQKEQEGVSFQVENVSFDENGVLYITAQAQNDTIQYTYKNWVLGEGKNVYQKRKILLVSSDKKTAYKLPTYPHATPSQSEKEADTQTTTGLTAYAPKKLMKQGPFSVAVLFEDREKKQTILYPKEEQTVYEK